MDQSLDMERNITRLPEVRLPSGYRFNPKDEELIMDYLFNKVHCNPLPSLNAVIDCDVYGDNYAWKQRFEDSKEDSLYFFMTLKMKTEKGNRVDRVTDSGTWRNQGDKKIFVGGEHIGSKRSFTFMPKKGVEQTGRWIMHEYRLDGITLNNRVLSEYVLCRIIRKNNKCK